ncbi:putative ABC-type xenobiotic transporter [Helianthus annuus]|nr:putative ABC-type xenobiotic transporter [Helianthus annuus]
MARWHMLHKQHGFRTGTVRENVLFRSVMDEVVKKCSLVKDIEMFPFGDQTIIGERGVNLSDGQKQRVQLAHAIKMQINTFSMICLARCCQYLSK